MSSDITLPFAIERLAIAGDRLVVQDEGSLFVFDLRRRSTRPLLLDREGADLVCAFSNGQVLILDTDGDLRVLDEDGKELARNALGEEAELGSVRMLPEQQLAVAIIPDMVGDEMLGIPRFRFLVTDDNLALTWIEHEWPRWPAVWTVDSEQRRLLVQAAEASHRFRVFALDNGAAGADVTIPAGYSGADALTSIDCAPDGSGFMLGQYSSANGYARISFVAGESEGDRTILCFEPGQGEVRGLSYSPDGGALVFQYGPAERPFLGYLDLAPDVDQQALKFLSILEPDTETVWSAPRQLVAITDETAITLHTPGGI